MFSFDFSKFCFCICDTMKKLWGNIMILDNLNNFKLHRNNISGHFKPNRKSMEKVNDYMDKLYQINNEIFSNKSKWRKK